MHPFKLTLHLGSVIGIAAMALVALTSLSPVSAQYPSAAPRAFLPRGFEHLTVRQVLPTPTLPGLTTTTTTTTTTAAPTTPPTNSTSSDVPSSASNSTTMSSSSSAPPASTSSSLPVSNTTTATNTTASATGTPSPTSTGDGIDSKTLIIAGGAVGGLVALIASAIVAFKCIVSKNEKKRRNKEIAATLSSNFNVSGGGGAGGAAGSKGYQELGDDHYGSSAALGGANLSRNGSKDAYYKETGGSNSDFYNPHYVQERYGGNNGTYGMYEETEMSVMQQQQGAYGHSPYNNNMPATYQNNGGYGNQQGYPAYGDMGYNHH